VGHDQIDVASAPDLVLAMMVDDQEERDERHGFPGEEEGKDAIGQDDQHHGCEEAVVGGAEAGERAMLSRQVAKGIERGCDANDGDHQDEVGCQRVQPEADGSEWRHGKGSQTHRAALQEGLEGQGRAEEAGRQGGQVRELRSNASANEGDG